MIICIKIIERNEIIKTEINEILLVFFIACAPYKKVLTKYINVSGETMRNIPVLMVLSTYFILLLLYPPRDNVKPVIVIYKRHI